jgi:hypothetical protein
MVKNAKLALMAALATAVLASSAVARPSHRDHVGAWQDSPAFTGGGSIGYNQAQENPNY